MDIGIHSRQEESVEIKDEMLMGLYNAELFFMPKELQHENEIKAVLDHQLSHDMAGLRITYSFETVGNSTRSHEMP